MSSYIFDALWKEQYFLGMNWSSKKGNQPIHVYCLELWDTKYKYSFKKVCNNSMSPLLSILTCELAPCKSECVREVVLDIGYRYVSPIGFYFCIYGSTKPPHLLPHYVPNKLVMIHIAYHNYIIGFKATMVRKIKSSWPSSPLQVGSYEIERINQEKVETNIFNVY